ncbi:MAG: HAD hydrolase family protein [SAR202 cluster bacterium]|nr:HAD hydrolase family protein [SAR202 cluster bacterium]MDP6514053.1 HAD hydrolase family protein [SAR202 cluster bacterium]
MAAISNNAQYKIFFDVDYTLLGVDGSLRPNARDALQRLVDDGHQIYVWSGNGIRWRDIRKHELESLVVDCIEKPVTDYANAVSTMDIKPDLVVDDHLEIVAALGGVWARTYYFPNSKDNEMEDIFRVITEWAQTGASDDPRFRAPSRY